MCTSWLTPEVVAAVRGPGMGAEDQAKLQDAAERDEPPRSLLVCPVHGIPDCSPLLNGCVIPNRIAAAWAEGWSAALAK